MASLHQQYRPPFMKIATPLSCCVAITLCGCATPTTHSTDTPLPASFEYQTTSAAPAWPAADWYRHFDSSELSALITLAEQNNADLAAAAARVRQADARARAAGAAILPQVDARGDITHLVGHTTDNNAHETDWSALLSAQYEVDFWGRHRAEHDAAKLSLAATAADHDTLALTLLSGVANTYFQVLSLRERLAVAQANLDTAQDELRVIESRYQARVASAADLALQKTVIANAQLLIPQLQQQELEARGALALLVGSNPEHFLINAQSVDALREPAVAPGMPSELLTRRPDLRSAEANLQAAHADVVAARAALFPSLSITASGGVQNPALQAAVLTLEGTGSSLTVGASLVQTLFDGGRRRALRDEAAARETELLAQYRGAILSALLDTEVALAAIQHLDAQQPAQLENASQSERAFEAAQLRYRAGSGDYLTVLEAQHKLYAARDQLSSYKLARLQSRVALCKALGGGWQTSSMPRKDPESVK